MIIAYWKNDGSGQFPMYAIVLTKESDVARVHALIDRTRLDDYDKELVHQALDAHKIVKFSESFLQVDDVCWAF